MRIALPGRTLSWFCAAAVLGACSHERISESAIPRPEPPPADRIATDEIATSMDTYYLSACAQCGGLLGTRGDAPEVVHNVRRYRVCSSACAAAFNLAPEACVERVNAIMIADQRPYYPLAVSLVSGRPLGPHPVEFVWGNRLFRASDPAERDLILSDPVRYVRQLNRAVLAAQSSSYGMPDKCPVQGDILPSDVPIDIVVANRMVRVCCGRCARVVRARPYQYLGMVEYANKHRSDAQPP
ncbi:MAG: hypothetical protein JNM07_00600 [Phycisphaerae bacterium]|nr:hypothetical protein [Phycisphaerae bacterium]